MTYEMKIQEERDEAREETRAEEQLSSIRKMMNKLGLTADKAMDVLDIPAEKREALAEKMPQICGKNGKSDFGNP